MLRIKSFMQKSLSGLEEPAYMLLHYGAVFAAGVLGLALLVMALPVSGVYSYIYTKGLFMSIVETSLTLLAEAIIFALLLDYVIKYERRRR